MDNYFTQKIAFATMLFMLGISTSFAQEAAPPPPAVQEALAASPIPSTPASTAATAAPVQQAEQPTNAPPAGTNTPPPTAEATSADAAKYQQWLLSQMMSSPQPALPPALEGQSNSPGLPPLTQPVPMPSVVKVKRPHLHFGDSLVISPPMTYQESQDAMISSLPVHPTSPDAEAAFNMLMQQNMPLTPQQVVRLRQLIDQSQRAASTPANVPPKPVSTTIMMNLAPGTTPPAIRLSQGYVTSLVFVDSTGAPWPIASYDIGDPKTTTIQWDGKSNVLLIQAVSPYGDSDLVIRLAGLMTPLTLELVSGQRVVDYRTDVHVAGIGPNAKDLPLGTTLPQPANQLLLGVLDGVAPPGSKLLMVKGGDCQGWLLGEKMYLRTRLTVLSPGWVGRMVSPDGMFAYELQKTSTVLVSQYGEPIELKIEGF